MLFLRLDLFWTNAVLYAALWLSLAWEVLIDMLLRFVLNTVLESVAAVVIGLEYFRVADIVGFAVDPKTSALFLTVEFLVDKGFILV